MNWNKSDYLAHWPLAIPYPYAIARNPGPVPNRSSVDWPQSQWAPLYLKAGSPSVQPYRYPKNGPLKSIVPDLYMARPSSFGTKRPAGDTAAVPGYFQPSAYGDALSGADCGCSGYSGPDCGCGGAKKNPSTKMIVLVSLGLIAALVYGPKFFR